MEVFFYYSCNHQLFPHRRKLLPGALYFMVEICCHLFLCCHCEMVVYSQLSAMEFGGGGVGGDGRACRSSAQPISEEDMDLRRGPWTVEEDLMLINHITSHGEGRWNSLASRAGLKRTGKSCRLRWLNYLRPDVRRGNITPEEQLAILELHSRWGNRWSKIAQHLPGRTDNEIKNYWRTRVQKHAKQLNCDVNSKQFKDVMRYLWMPRLLERIQATNPGSTTVYQNLAAHAGGDLTTPSGSELGQHQLGPSPESSSGPVSSSFDSASVGTQLSSPVTVTTGEDKESDGTLVGQSRNCEYWTNWSAEPLSSPCGYPNLELPELDWWPNGDLSETLWSMENNWLIQQQQL